MEEMKEEKKEISPLDYMTIPVSEYRNLISIVERLKAEEEVHTEMDKLKEEADMYARMWREEREKATELRINLDDAKDQIATVLKVKEEKEGKNA